MIYKIGYCFQHYYSMLIDGIELYSRMPTYNPRFLAEPRLETWIAPKASFFASHNYEGKGEVLPDITTWSLGNLILNPKAYSVLHDLLSKTGEFLPILINEETYYIFNTLFVMPKEAEDTSKAIEIIDSGVHLGQENVFFDESVLNGGAVFKTNTDKLVFSYCTEEFKSIYEQHRFTGLLFDNAYRT